MKQTINLSSFRDAFHRMGRGDTFSAEGLKILFDWLEELDPDYELDVIGICCDFYEADEDTIRCECRIPDDEDVMDYLEGETCVIGTTRSGSIVYQAF